MNRILYENRCKCNEEFSIAKKRKLKTLSEGKPFQYPKSREITSKTFQIKYQKNLSLTAKFILNSFQNKYIYYAIDDILYSLRSEPIERNNILAVLYSPIISLQNNFSVNFFDIWIREVYIEEVSKTNKFLKTDSQTLKKFNYITIKFFYKTRVPVKKQESLW
uniref:ycf88 n=1 Tax=Cocconeiopsis kantsiensis TaxID=3082010 RepID=UPI00300316ED